MTTADNIWALIPAVYQRRDSDAGGVLQALISVFAEQVGLIYDDIATLYDNWFIETCDDWVVPYIGELTGALPLVPTGDPLSPAEATRLTQVAPPRLLVANAIRFRRRKGCFSIIAQVAHDVARWPALAVEFGTLLTLNQDVRAPFARGASVTVRDRGPLASLDTPDDTLARSTDVRDAEARRSPGRYGPANIGVFVFTPLIASVVNGDAFCVDEEGSACFCFGPLGQDVALYHPALTEGGGTRLPGPITRAMRARQRSAGDPADPPWAADPALYGPTGCTLISTQAREGAAFEPVDKATLVQTDLGRWRERPPLGFVALDPERGRIAFPPRAAPRRVQVTYSYAMPAPIGGGDYPRSTLQETFANVYPVTASQEEGHNSLRAAVEEWAKDGADRALIEFRDSLTYDEDRLVIDFAGAGRRLVIRAAAHMRPVIRLSNYEAGAADAWRIRGDGGGASLVLDGLAISGRGIAVSDYGGSLEIRHCTLFPGWQPGGERGRRHPEAASLSLENCTGWVSIAASILGPIFVAADEHIDDALPIALADSILDAGDAGPAFMSSGAIPYVMLSLRRCTVFGPTRVHAVTLAENSIFTDRLAVARRGVGCVRFCALPLDSRTPRRVACVPRAAEHADLRPVFVSRTFGSIGYAMLAARCPEPITRGADDRSEMGAYHDLFHPQRDTNLRAALTEYLPAGSSVGIIYVS
jgi:hypothetical protein